MDRKQISIIKLYKLSLIPKNSEIRSSSCLQNIGKKEENMETGCTYQKKA